MKLFALATLLIAWALHASTFSTATSLQSFPAGDVHLLPGSPFATALEANREERSPVPTSVRDAAPDGLLTVEFPAGPGQIAGGIFDLSLVKTDQATAASPASR